MTDYRRGDVVADQDMAAVDQGLREALGLEV